MKIVGNYYFRLATIGIVLFVLLYRLVGIYPAMAFPYYQALLPAMILISLAGHAVFVISLEQESGKEKVVVLLAALGIKMILYLFLIALYFYLGNRIYTSFILVFFASYVVLTVHDIAFKLKLGS